MEVRPGYKQTEVGVIPEEWDIAPLGSRASFRTGPFGSALHKSDYTNDGIPVVNPMHIAGGRIAPTRTMTITEQAAKNLADFRMSQGEVIIGRRGDMGRCAVVREHHAGWLCGTGSMLIRPQTTDATFLQRVLSSPRAVAAIEEASVGTTMVNLNQATLAGLKLQFPPLPEQRAIATALSDVDALLDGLDRLIAKKRDLKQATMQQLLTGQTRLPGMSAEWQEVRLVDIAEFCAGTYLAQEQYRDGHYEVQGAGASMGRHDAANISKPLTVVGRVGTIGKPRFFSNGCWVNNNAAALVARSNAVPKYVHLLLLSLDWSKVVSVTAQPFLVVPDLMNTNFMVPSPDEQSAIADVLSDMDAEIAALEARRDKTRALKQGMMQELLTGRTRLVNPGDSHD